MQGIVEKLQLETIDVPCAVMIWLMWPDRRRRDVDNCAKALLDALVKGGLLSDDSSHVVQKLLIEHRGYQEGGAALVRVSEL